MVGWIRLPNAQKRAILAQVSNQNGGINEQVIEKDAWVTLVLDALFQLPEIRTHLVFKGGTSLSKGYNLIGRFSEDIDFAIDRRLLGFPDKDMSGKQIRSLRRASAEFVKGTLATRLGEQLQMLGLSEQDFSISFQATTQSDIDPLPLYVEYKPVSGASNYLSDKVILEVGARSLIEPFEERMISSMIAEVYPEQKFSGTSFPVPTVLPARTFLEKLFLLHELFLQPEQSLPRNRMSRHLYDIEKLLSTEHAKQALLDKVLFEHIVEHRQKLTPIKGISYEQHTPTGINFLPPSSVMRSWKEDYNQFISHMVTGQQLSFEALIEKLAGFQDGMRNITW